MNKYAADRPAMWKRSGWSTIQIRCALPNSSNISLKITIQPKQTGKGPTSAHSTRDRRCAEKHSDPERRASRHADFACPSFLACRGLPSGLLSETRPDAILSSLCAAVLAQSNHVLERTQPLHIHAIPDRSFRRGFRIVVRLIGIPGGLVRIGRFNDLHSPDNTGHRAAGTVKEGEIAQLHGFEKIAGLIAANAIPSVYAVRLLPQIINAKGLRFRFQKPVGHLKLSALSKQALE